MISQSRNLTVSLLAEYYSYLALSAFIGVTAVLNYGCIFARIVDSGSSLAVASPNDEPQASPLGVGALLSARLHARIRLDSVQ